MRPSDGETLEWIRRAQAGDDEAFESLFNKHKNLVFRTSFLMLGNLHDAEDLLQEVFLEVHRSLRQYRPDKGAFTTWLYRITMNDCLNSKRKRRLQIVSFDDVTNLRHVFSETDIDFDHSVQHAVNRLSPKLRAIVVLRYYAELSYAELTEVLEIPLGTVKSRLNQALHTLKGELSQRAEREALASRHATFLRRVGDA
jgi:RNA polymerase sigma-70 factor (ECF subfamily)